MSERRCPRCTFTLVPHPVGQMELDTCPRCHGIYVERHEMAHVLGPYSDIATWAKDGAAITGGDSRLRCPIDQSHLRVWHVSTPDGGSVEVDTCPRCRGLWLDAAEAQRLKGVSKRMLTPLPTPAAFGDGMTINAPPPGQEKTGPGWYLFQLFTSMPLEVYNPKRNAAVVCIALVVACIVAFVIEIGAIGGGDETFIMRYGAVASSLFKGQHLPSAITHMFLHGGIAHLAGNMWMLWVFGDNIEDRVGRARFLRLYLAFGLVALILQLALTTDPNVPLVGASGAIGGLMGAYLGLFPHARLFQVIFFYRWTIPAWLYVGAWAALNLVIGVAELNHTIPDSKVAWWAHVGGFAAGLGWALLFGRSRYGDGAELRATSAG